MQSKLIQQIDLQIINQDWEKLSKCYSEICKKHKENQLHSKKYVEEWDGILYNLDKFGSLFYGNDKGIVWYTWSGQLLESMCPWVKEAKTLFKDINFKSLSYQVTTEGIPLHVDSKIEAEKDEGQCKINFIVETQNEDIITTVIGENIVDSYRSIPNTAWLIDTNYPHSLNGKGRRVSLQFKFFNNFETVSNFFQNQGQITFKSY